MELQQEQAVKKIHARQYEITDAFLKVLDEHLADLLKGRVDEMYELRDIAKVLHIHPTHMTDTIKHVTGFHPCVFFQDKIIAIAKSLLEKNNMSINAIATTLTYDPSNFTKFFKRFTQQTPKQYREAFLTARHYLKTETITI
ncbi:helix-turn-helix transcriptional regulator [Taibaiella lutea]|uniref:Helix-turn-helix transcriptional regulator n=1 Tax=Taibaiella lutea TaxID=2608001 RepID=A0A5M6CMN8_9BACT|nr:AraC family transcriptional regulator [Taibaiella lutea]KAA5536468.1 helix-turn-helix transcriptional regulator [Taibaiella lutea]